MNHSISRVCFEERFEHFRFHVEIGMVDGIEETSVYVILDIH